FFPQILQHGAAHHGNRVALELDAAGRLKLVHRLHERDETFLFEVLGGDLCGNGGNDPLPGLGDQVTVMFDDKVPGSGRAALLELDPGGGEIVVDLGSRLSDTHQAPASAGCACWRAVRPKNRHRMKQRRASPASATANRSLIEGWLETEGSSRCQYVFRSTRS